MDDPEELKKHYVETINELIKKCDDIELLDLIIRLLRKRE
jgi:hypothetical protein